MKNFLNQIGNLFVENRTFISGLLWGMCIMSFINLYQSIDRMSQNLDKINSQIEKIELNEKH